MTPDESTEFMTHIKVHPESYAILKHINILQKDTHILCVHTFTKIGIDTFQCTVEHGVGTYNANRQQLWYDDIHSYEFINLDCGEL